MSRRDEFPGPSFFKKWFVFVAVIAVILMGLFVWSLILVLPPFVDWLNRQ